MPLNDSSSQRYINMFSMGQQLDISMFGTPVANPIPQPFLKNQFYLSQQQGSETGSVYGFDNGVMGFDTSWNKQQVDTEPSLDPLEEKILFNMEDDTSSISEIASGVLFGNSSSFANSFPSTNSGTWSALMQTALTEASSSDTGHQEEFSSLTYQNTEQSADINDISNFMDTSNKQQGSSSFPGFQQVHSFNGLSTSNNNMYLQSSGIFDQLQSHPFSTADSSQIAGGVSSLDHLSKTTTFPQFVQHNDLATVYASQMQTISPFVPCQTDNATMQMISPFVASHTSSQTISPQQGINRQFNVWMDLPTRQHNMPSYNMPQRVGLPQEQGISSTSQVNSFSFDDQKIKQPSGSSFIASSMERSHLNLPASSTPIWFGAFKNNHMQQPALDSPQHSKPLDTINKHDEITVSKKRKRLPWHEEVSNASSQRNHTSMAEEEWARVSNLLIDKEEYNNTQSFEFALPLHRSKRRLIITSQLIQHLFHPPPSLSADALLSSYTSIFFFVTRSTLGDACTLTQRTEIVLPSSSSLEVDKLTEKTQVVKELAEKAKKLDESLERMEKTLLISDIRCEIEDLERFSVINRFARFHIKASADNNNSVRPMPQRYVAVRPIMPQNIPNGVHCLLL